MSSSNGGIYYEQIDTELFLKFSATVHSFENGLFSHSKYAQGLTDDAIEYAEQMKADLDLMIKELKKEKSK